MKIALLGYGKMGQVIERLARRQGHYVVLRVDENNREALSDRELAQADVAIEFTRPEAAVRNIRWCLRAGVPVVVGTTGWLANLGDVERATDAAGGAVFYASNFSIGVNVFFAAAQQMGRLLGQYGGYAASVEETHHTQKLDSPSGTAITLAERYAAEHPDLKTWYLDKITSPVGQGRVTNPSLPRNFAPAPAPKPDYLPIHSIREEGVPGTHTLRLTSPVDTIELKHTAHSREGFAKGALVAASWLVGKRGVYSMPDLLKI